MNNYVGAVNERLRKDIYTKQPSYKDQLGMGPPCVGMYRTSIAGHKTREENFNNHEKEIEKNFMNVWERRKK